MTQNINPQLIVALVDFTRLNKREGLHITIHPGDSSRRGWNRAGKLRDSLLDLRFFTNLLQRPQFHWTNTF